MPSCDGTCRDSTTCVHSNRSRSRSGLLPTTLLLWRNHFRVGASSNRSAVLLQSFDRTVTPLSERRDSIQRALRPRFRSRSASQLVQLPRPQETTPLRASVEAIVDCLSLDGCSLEFAAHIGECRRSDAQGWADRRFLGKSICFAANYFSC